MRSALPAEPLRALNCSEIDHLSQAHDIAYPLACLDNKVSHQIDEVPIDIEHLFHSHFLFRTARFTSLIEASLGLLPARSSPRCHACENRKKICSIDNSKIWIKPIFDTTEYQGKKSIIDGVIFNARKISGCVKPKNRP